MTITERFLWLMKTSISLFDIINLQFVVNLRHVHPMNAIGQWSLNVVPNSKSQNSVKISATSQVQVLSYFLWKDFHPYEPSLRTQPSPYSGGKILSRLYEFIFHCPIFVDFPDFLFVDILGLKETEDLYLKELNFVNCFTSVPIKKMQIHNTSMKSYIDLNKILIPKEPFVVNFIGVNSLGKDY